MDKSSPLAFQRNVRFSHICDLELRLVDIFVTPPTEMEAKTPRGLPRRKTYQLAILLDNLLWARSREEIEVQSPANLPIFDKGDVRRWWGQ